MLWLKYLRTWHLGKAPYVSKLNSVSADQGSSVDFILHEKIALTCASRVVLISCTAFQVWCPLTHRLLLIDVVRGKVFSHHPGDTTTPICVHLRQPVGTVVPYQINADRQALVVAAMMKGADSQYYYSHLLLLLQHSQLQNVLSVLGELFCPTYLETCHHLAILFKRSSIFNDNTIWRISVSCHQVHNW